jgi:hypothetical protein
MDLVNQSRTPIPLKNVLSVMDPVNQPGTPKLWAIAYENNHKLKNYKVFCHASQTYTECHGPSARNPKTVGNSSQKQP